MTRIKARGGAEWAPLDDYESVAIFERDGRPLFLHLYRPAHVDEHGIPRQAIAAACRVNSMACSRDGRFVVYEPYGFPWDSVDEPMWYRDTLVPGSRYFLVENDGSCQWPNGSIIAEWGA